MGCSCDHPGQMNDSSLSPLVPMSAEPFASQKRASRCKGPGVVPVHPGAPSLERYVVRLITTDAARTDFEHGKCDLIDRFAV